MTLCQNWCCLFALNLYIVREITSLAVYYNNFGTQTYSVTGSEKTAHFVHKMNFCKSGFSLRDLKKSKVNFFGAKVISPNLGLHSHQKSETLVALLRVRTRSLKAAK